VALINAGPTTPAPAEIAAVIAHTKAGAAREAYAASEWPRAPVDFH
jgi:hypothetical protein